MNTGVQKNPKILFYSRFLFCISEQVCCNTSQYLLRVQLLISQTFPMVLPARSRRHQTPEGRRRRCCCCLQATPGLIQHGATARLSFQPAHGPRDRQSRAGPPATSPKVVGKRENRKQPAHLGLISINIKETR